MRVITRLHRLLALSAQQQALIFLVLIATLGRLLPHPDNITPLAAIGLFAGAYLNHRAFLLIPLLAALLSDLAGPGFYNLTVMMFVYAGLLLSSVTGRLLLHNKVKLKRVPVAVLLMSLGFYIVSNIGSWWAFYPHSMEGLMNCYVNGLPYFFRTVLGNSMYSFVFIGAFEWMRNTAQKTAVAAI